jgi:hypothetical protein
MGSKKRILLSGGVIGVLLLASLLGAVVVSAQEDTPDAEAPSFSRGRHSDGLLGWAGSGQWSVFDAAAEALGLSPVELFTELHAGQSLDEVAEAHGVDVDTVHEAMDAVREDATRDAIAQAVADGEMTQEHADWMLEGIEQGFLPRGRGSGHGPGRGGMSRSQSE